MKIKSWGSRGSIPVSGKEYLKYGGDTTSLKISTKSDDIIAVDAGTGIRNLGNDLIKNGSKFRWKDIAIIFQGAMNALNPVLKVGEQIDEVGVIPTRICT